MNSSSVPKKSRWRDRVCHSPTHSCDSIVQMERNTVMVTILIILGTKRNWVSFIKFIANLTETAEEGATLARYPFIVSVGRACPAGQCC